MMAGFPLAFISDGWHTSMSFQIFVTEFIIDLFAYYLFWFLIIFFINKYFKKINVHKYLTATLLILATLIIIVTTYIMAMPENIFKIKRDFNVDVIKTGYKFTWQHKDRPDINKYYPFKINERPTLHLRTLGHDQQTSTFYLYCTAAMGLTVH